MNYRITADPNTDQKIQTETELEIHNWINTASLPHWKMISEATIRTRKGNRFTIMSRVNESGNRNESTLDMIFTILPREDH